MITATDIGMFLRYGVPVLIIWGLWNLFEAFWLWTGFFDSAEHASMAGLGSVFVFGLVIAYIAGSIIVSRKDRYADH